MERDYPVRKRNRLQEYDYSQNGAYFVTICTKDKRPVLWEAGVGAIMNRPLPLSEYGQIVEQGISNIEKIYSGVSVDKYVIMPNHIHMILMFQQYPYDFQRHADACGESGRLIIAPTTLSEVIRQLKSYSTKQIGVSIWQRSFHDHIIRNDEDYGRIWLYIDNNPLNWEKDCFYLPLELE